MDFRPAYGVFQHRIGVENKKDRSVSLRRFCPTDAVFGSCCCLLLLNKKHSFAKRQDYAFFCAAIGSAVSMATPHLWMSPPRAGEGAVNPIPPSSFGIEVQRRASISQPVVHHFGSIICE
jgi:hypothetical protein